MSRVYFHSQHGTAELRGSERAHLSLIVDNITAEFLSPPRSDEVDRLLTLIHPGHYLHSEDRRAPDWVSNWCRTFTTALNVAPEDSLLEWKGRPVNPFAIRLNTALKHNDDNDTIRLAARLHGQCEIHAYVEGANRAWFAALITEGLDAGILREGQWFTGWRGDRKWSAEGWRDVVKLLLDRDDEPVVTSYSVCDGFPNAAAANWTPPPMPEDWVPDWVKSPEDRAKWELEHPEREDRQEYYDDEASSLWYDQPEDEQWRQALAGIRSNPGMLEISPENFRGYYFAHGLAITDLLAPDYAERLDKALGVGEDGGEQ